MRETWETRCNERIEIALFRVSDVQKDAPALDVYHKQTIDAKGPLIAEIKENGAKFLKRPKEASEFANSGMFRVAEFKGKFLDKLATVNETDQAYLDFRDQIEKHLKAYNDLVLANPDLQRLADKVEDETLPIRFLPTPPRCRVLPGTGVKLCIGRCGNAARDAEQ
jgi:hypothetical protein